ncbi:MAG: transcription elongation factor GreA [Candidatus Jorgensenbacteria bacterium]
MQDHQAYLTQERHDELTAELQELKTAGRKGIAERLKHSKDMGDLSENFDYQEARDEQVRLEQHILQIEELLKRSVIIKKSEGVHTARIGSKVTVQKGKTVVVYTIVGSNEAHPAAGLISNESPLGRGVLGKKVGDMVSVRAPVGETAYQILAIE